MLRGRHWCDDFGGLRATSVEDCPASSCGRLKAGARVLFPVDGRKLLCKVLGTDSKEVRVEAPGGSIWGGSLHWAESPEWGQYCPHGVQVIEAIPAEHDCQPPKPPCPEGKDPWHECPEVPACPACYPTGRKILPWACAEEGCSEADFDRVQQEEVDDYHQSLIDECYHDR